MSIQFSGHNAYNMGYATRPQLSKEQLTEAAGHLFGKLDSQNKGYLEQSDFSGLLSGLQTDEASNGNEVRANPAEWNVWGNIPPNTGRNSRLSFRHSLIAIGPLSTR